MNASKAGYQTGWALPTTLFALAITLSTLYVLSLESIDALLIATEPRHSERLHAAVTGAVKNSSAPSGGCQRLSATYEGSAIPYEVCYESARPFITLPASIALPPLPIDYDLIFSWAAECPSSVTPTRFNDMNSPFAPSDCSLPSSVGAPMIILDNLEGESVIVHRGGGPNASLATPGRVTIAQELRVSSDLLILAGGDVMIAGIKAIPSTSSKVTIISAVGRVRVGSVEGDVSLLLAGRGELTAPDTRPSSEYPLPIFRATSIFGFRPIN